MKLPSSMEKVEFTVLVPLAVEIPLHLMNDLIHHTEDLIAAQSEKVIGTPPVYLDDLLSQANLANIIKLPDGWELPTDGNKIIHPNEYRRERKG